MILIMLAPTASTAAQPGEQLLQLLDYVAVDYPEAVQEGEISNPAEYAEMRNFADTIVALVERLPEGPERPGLAREAARLASLIDERAGTEIVRTLAGAMRIRVITGYAVAVAPRQTPEPALAGRLYADNCAICHGTAGYGDGSAAPRMDPPPTDFHNRERYLQRSPYGLYATISLGVAGTAMPSFSALSEHERWSLAFYVGALGGAEDATRLADAAASPLADPMLLATLSPADAVARHGESALAQIAWLRAHPVAVRKTGESPLATSRALLAQSVDAYRQGARDEALRLAIAAYLEGFEMAESALDVVDHGLRLAVEQDLTRYRSAVGSEAKVGEIEQLAEAIDLRLAGAESMLAGSRISASAAFVSAFLILLREGLEALLVITALIAILVKVDHARGLPYVHAGWIGALVLGALTWWVATNLVDFGGAARELTESIVALLAAAVLFYVGFWMHRRSHAAQWQQFVRSRVERAMGTSNLWALAGLSFVAVYREVFETILFYQALWLQTDPAGHTAVLAGFSGGAGALAMLGWMILRYGMRLPLRPFFAASAIFMFVLAVVMVGKGLEALQAAGKLPVSSIAFPRIEFLGIYPNLQSLGAQAAVITVAVLLTTFRQRKYRQQ